MVAAADVVRGHFPPSAFCLIISVDCWWVAGRCEPAAGMLISCAGCEKPILDKFLLNVLERTWHNDCVRCFDCHSMLTDKCFTREGKLFCRTDFFR